MFPFMTPKVLTPRSHRELMVDQKQLLHFQDACDVGSFQDSENAEYYHTEKEGCFAGLGNDICIQEFSFFYVGFLAICNSAQKAMI